MNNYIAVKYHVKTSWASNVIGLHNFKNGYCGISQIEEGKYCVCYLTTAANLKKSSNSIQRLQENIMFKNPALKQIFSASEILYDAPLTISQISFSRKSLVENHMLMTGDTAGMITPLCGNGMSMALHSSKIAALCIDRFLRKEIGQEKMEIEYQRLWKKNFSRRVAVGRALQSFFGATFLSNLFVTVFKAFPFFAKGVISKTHGNPF